MSGDLRERVAKAVYEFNSYPGTRSWQPSWDGEDRSRGTAEMDSRRAVALADAILAELAPELVHVPPDGTEAVFLRPETVDQAAAGGGVVIITAARATQARRPKPEPKTERVPLNPSTLGRTLAANGREITGINITRGSTHKGRPAGWHIATGGTTDVVLPLDATHVEVLVEQDQ